MQTFMTHCDPIIISGHLDYKRLNKQVSEGLQIIDAAVFGSGWENHPAVRQWLGHEHFLALYVDAMIIEWQIVRNYKSHYASSTRVRELLRQLPHTGKPPWWGDPEIIRSHQSNLIRKNPGHYRPLFPGVPDNLPYIWPSRNSVPQTTL